MKFCIKIVILAFIGLILSNASFSQRKIRNHFFKQRSFEKYLYAAMPEFKALLDSPEVYRTQIYFSKIKRDKNGNVKFTDYHFKKHNLYYYPASCVKLPVIVEALHKIKEQKISLNDSLVILDNAYCGFKNQTEIQNGWAIQDYMKRMLVVSNNICFNPLYNFQDRNWFYTTWQQKYFIQQRFNYACDSAANSMIGNLKIINSKNEVVYSVPPITQQTFTLNSSWATAGLRYLDNKDSLINHPKSFAKSNYIELKNLQDLIKKIVSNSIEIRNEDRDFLLKYMSIYPSECRHPAYDKKEYPDNWGKYLLIGDDTSFVKNDSIRIFNKVGMAYGFLTDCAYIVDYKNQVEFIASSSVFVDRDGTLNDGKYAYKEIGLPFLSKLGRVLMQYEKMEHKKRNNFYAIRLKYDD